MKKNLIIVISVICLLLCGVGAYLLNMGKTVHLVYMADSKYLPYMMTSLYSAIKNKNRTTKYHVHVIAKDFSNKDKTTLQKLTAKNIDINIYDAEDKNLDTSHLGRFGSFNISLQKLFIADYLKEIDKVLYLDSDTLVQSDLSKVYDTPVENVYVAAVKDGLMYQFPEHIDELSLRDKNFYFNSGVMLLNLNKIRNDKIINRALIYFNTHQDVFGDQDILNVVFKGKVTPLSYRYNCNSVFFEEKDAKFLSAFWNEPVPETPKAVYDNTVILHFAGHKPWTPYFTQAYLKTLWQTYADELKTKYLEK